VVLAVTAPGAGQPGALGSGVPVAVTVTPDSPNPAARRTVPLTTGRNAGMRVASVVFVPVDPEPPEASGVTLVMQLIA
jgi:hypothetical protein